MSEFPLFLFTTCAGLSAGAYIASVFCAPKQESKNPWVFQLICLALLAIGGVGVMFHLGRPAMFLNALMNPMAGIAQEGYLTIIYGVLLIVDIALASKKGESVKPLTYITALAALLLTLVMGFAYVNNLGVAAWASMVSVPFFVAGDIAMGAALYACFCAGAYKQPVYFALTAAAEVIFAVALILEIQNFSALGFDVMLFWAALVLAPVAATAIAFVARGKDENSLALAACICAIAGVVLARWAFYAVCVI